MNSRGPCCGCPENKSPAIWGLCRGPSFLEIDSLGHCNEAWIELLYVVFLKGCLTAHAVCASREPWLASSRAASTGCGQLRDCSAGPVTMPKMFQSVHSEASQ